MKDKQAREDIKALGEAVYGLGWEPSIVMGWNTSLKERLDACTHDDNKAERVTERLSVRYCPNCGHRTMMEQVANSDDAFTDMAMLLRGEPRKVRYLTCGTEFKEAPDTLIPAEKGQ